jgi:hypothetical protein
LIGCNQIVIDIDDKDVSMFGLNDEINLRLYKNHQNYHTTTYLQNGSSKYYPLIIINGVKFDGTFYKSYVVSDEVVFDT